MVLWQPLEVNSKDIRFFAAFSGWLFPWSIHEQAERSYLVRHCAPLISSISSICHHLKNTRQFIHCSSDDRNSPISIYLQTLGTCSLQNFIVGVWYRATSVFKFGLFFFTFCRRPMSERYGSIFLLFKNNYHYSLGITGTCLSSVLGWLFHTWFYYLLFLIHWTCVLIEISLSLLTPLVKLRSH